MNLARAAIVLRPRGVLGAGDLAFRLVFSLRPRLWLGLSALTLLPGAAGCGALHYVWDVAWGWVWFAALSYGSLAQGVFTTAVGLLMFDRRASASTILGHYLRRLVPHAVAVAWTRLLALGTLPISGLGAYLWVRWAHVHEAVLLEQAGAIRAGRRSADFVRGHLDDAVLLVASVSGLSLVLVCSMEAMGHGVEQVLLLPVQLENLWDEGGSAYALFGYFAAVPFGAVIRFLAYVDGRTRRDGWDIQVRFMALVHEHESNETDARGLAA